MSGNWERSAGFETWPGCLGCGHYSRSRCVAFPDGIPLPIASGEIDHLVPRPGQVGDTVFEPLEPDVFRREGRRVPGRVAQAR